MVDMLHGTGTMLIWVAVLSLLHPVFLSMAWVRSRRLVYIQKLEKSMLPITLIVILGAFGGTFLMRI
ncbi:MAG: hypothetical protein Q7S63_00375 [bacterium]|nr:hypothetical protein [bacterium]